MGGRTAVGGQVITLNAPVGAKAVTINVTSVHALTKGYVQAYPANTPKPETSRLNYSPGLEICNEIMVPVKDGKYSLYVSKPTHIIVDQVGFWT